MPVLDGFDEIADGLRAAALAQLSDDLPLVLSSRTKEFGAAMVETRGVRRAAVIELTNLALDDVTNYLRLATPKLAAGPDPHTSPNTTATRWDAVLNRLTPVPDGPAANNLARALTTPLMVALARTIYSDADRDPMILLDAKRFHTAADIEHHLLGCLVPSVYRVRPQDRNAGRTPAWRPDQAQRWFGYLATHLATLGTPDLAWWEVGSTLNRWIRTLVVVVLAGFALGAPTAIGNIPVDLVATSRGLGFAIHRGLLVGVFHGVLAGLAFGLMYAIAAVRRPLKPSPVQVRLTGGPRRMGAALTGRLKIGVPLGLAFALAIVLVDAMVVAPLGFDDGLSGGLLLSVLVFVLPVGAAIGLVVVLMTWLEVPINPRNAVSPADVLSANRNNVLVQMLVAALVFGVGGWLGASFRFGPLRSFEAGLVFGIEAAFAGGLGYGLALTAWGQWSALARIWLPLTGRLPWRVIAFLDDACRRGVLRQAGAVYQFRHAQLQDHLATASEPGRPRTPA